jgi:hypothetical protein
VWFRHSVGSVRGQRWQDVLLDHRVAGWVDAGLVSMTGPHGESAPVDLPRRRCCGDA